MPILNSSIIKGSVNCKAGYVGQRPAIPVPFIRVGETVGYTPGGYLFSSGASLIRWSTEEGGVVTAMTGIAPTVPLDLSGQRLIVEENPISSKGYPLGWVRSFSVPILPVAAPVPEEWVFDSLDRIVQIPTPVPHRIVFNDAGIIVSVRPI